MVESLSSKVSTVWCTSCNLKICSHGQIGRDAFVCFSRQRSYYLSCFFGNSVTFVRLVLIAVLIFVAFSEKDICRICHK